MSVKSHAAVDTNIPNPAHAKKRLVVVVNSTTVPERIMPNGVAAEANAPRTEVTLPCIFMGTTICLIV